MNYKSGSAKIELKTLNVLNLNTYMVKTECGYMVEGDFIDWGIHLNPCLHRFSELEILMISYFNLGLDDIKWPDARYNYERDFDYPFGGVYIDKNIRFDSPDDALEENNSWLEQFADINNWLTVSIVADCMCNTIEKISVVYCDKNGKLWDCEFPDLYELFDTEEEFIKYIKTLKLKEEEKRLLD